MENASYIAMSGQTALQRRMEVVANNLANLSTPAYKGEQMVFSQYIVQPPGKLQLAFVQDVSTVRDMRDGPLTKTGNSLDLALQGEGFFQVQTPLGTRFTRNGHFQLDAQGQIVTSQGYPVLSDGGQPITVPSDANGIAVGPDGTVSVGKGSIGKVQAVTFAQPQLATPAANGFFVTDQDPVPAEGTKILQGSIEESNVNSVLELTRLLDASRAASSMKNFIDAEDTRQKNAIDRLSKIS
ncbi:MAG TPA: flagellar basal-body rod protein FlgF [Stellaceae bacterium]|nr:flagellar basal-body rod protein FlgF [Stellaceae bacterium]